MSDWRKWARVAVGAIIAVIVFTAFMNIWGDYQTAKQAQKRRGAVRADDSGPASTVTKTGRPPLTTATSTTGDATPTASKSKVVLVVVDGVNLRTTPSTTGDIIRALKKNERLVYYLTKKGYYQVADKSGTKGWVSANRDYTRLVSSQ